MAVMEVMLKLSCWSVCVIVLFSGAIPLTLESRVKQLPEHQEGTRDAYVTLLHGGFLLGARVLGQSLRETGTKKDVIVLCTEEVPDSAREILQADGWIVRPVHKIANPYEGFSNNASYVYWKLLIWNMTEYDRIVYLDSDSLVLSNIDHLFDCGTFCITYRQSDLFNTGVMVVEPSTAVFNDMINKTSSYTNGEEGFLNFYFRDLAYASMFNWSDSTRQRQPKRLPAGLNADVGLYYANSRWDIIREDLRIIQYTLGLGKPWKWWTSGLFDLNWQWTDVRMRLPRHDDRTNTLYCLAPFFLLALIYILLSCFGFFCMSNLAYPLKLFSSFNARFYHIFPLVFLFLSYLLAFKIVPTTMMPRLAEFVFWLWFNCFVLIFFTFYCQLCYATDRHGNNNSIGKSLMTIALYTTFAISCILLKAIPPHIEPFSFRVEVFCILVIIHLAVSQVTGQWVIAIWTVSRPLTHTHHSPKPLLAV